MLFNLPEELAAVIIQDWVATIKDISSLDIACSHHTVRHDFLHVIGQSSCRLVDPYAFHSHQTVYIKWLSLRHISISEVSICVDDLTKLAELQPALHLPHVETIHLHPPLHRLHHLDDLISIKRVLCGFPSLCSLDCSAWSSLQPRDLSIITSAAAQNSLRIRAWNLQSCAYVTDASIEQVVQGFAAHIEEIHTDLAKFSDAVLIAIATRCKKLKAFTFDCSLMSQEAILKVCADCKVLRSLHVICRSEHSPMQDALVQAIADSIPRLVVLDMSGCDAPSLMCFPHVVQRCSELREFATGHMEYTVREDGRCCDITLLDDAMIAREVLHVVDSCPHPIRQFNARDGCELTATILELLASKSGPALRKCSATLTKTGINDDTIVFVLSCCKHISHLELENCQQFTDGILHTLVQSCSMLQSLCLVDATQITDEGIMHVLSSFRQQMRVLVLEGCDLISDDSLAAVNCYCPALTMLDVRETAITLNGLKAFTAHGYRQLAVLNVDESLALGLLEDLQGDELICWKVRLNPWLL